jgi:chromosome segregation ATPase
MTEQLLTIDRQPLTDRFDRWRSEQSEFDSQLNESLEALTAYQSHLDTWQRELAAEREQIGRERAELESDRGNLTCDLDQLNKLRDQLGESRDKCSALTTDLLGKSEELRSLDKTRAELTTELELTRAREQNLAASLEQEKQKFAEQQAHWSDEFKQMRAMLEHRSAGGGAGRDPAAVEGPVPSSQPTDQPLRNRDSSSDPVVGSIVAQFDKLRQQQAEGRRTPQKK